MEIFTRTELIEAYEKREGGQMSDYQKEYYTNEFDQHRLNDNWNQKGFGAKIGMLLTSHPGNRGFLKASVESHKQTGHWLAVAYDNYWDKERQDIDYNWVMPPRDVFDKIDTFVIPHHQSWGGVLYPYFWLLYFGLQTMGGFEYVYCANGDCVLEKPENFDRLLEMLGDGDIMGIGNEDAGWSRVFNTTGFVAKTKSAQAIMKHFGERLIPFDNYVKYTQSVGNTEARFSQAIKDLGLKEVVVEKNPYNTQLHVPGGTWYDLVGFRHIHGEFNWAWKLLTEGKLYEGCIPPLKYLDKRQASIPEEFLAYYRKTGQLLDEQPAP
jgi:hypothetical protein